MRSARIRYNAEEMAWLEANYRMVISDYQRAFSATFGREDVSISNLNQLRKRKGWRVGRDGKRYVGRLRMFSNLELAWLGENRTLPIEEYWTAFQGEFGREDVTRQKLQALRKRQRWKTGRTGRFDAGAVPANKGKKMPYNANSARTQFKAGRLPHNTKYLGHRRVNVDGYVEVSVDEKHPGTGYERRYVHEHRYLWEKVNGPIPDDHVLKCLGDKTNTDPANWEMIPRAMLPHLNGRHGVAYDTAEPQVKPVVLTLAKVKHRVREAKARRRETA